MDLTNHNYHSTPHLLSHSSISPKTFPNGHVIVVVVRGRSLSSNLLRFSRSHAQPCFPRSRSLYQKVFFFSWGVILIFIKKLICVGFDFSFIVSFSFNNANPENDGKRVQEFFMTMESAIKDHPLWANATIEDIDSAMEVINFIKNLKICFSV